MTLPPDSLMVRVHMEQQIAIIVAAVDVPASLILARIFGRVLPELLDFKLPKLVPKTLDLDARACVGTYADGRVSVRVSFSECDGLEAEITESRSDRDAAPQVLRTELRPGTDRAYLANSSARRFFQWIQFISRDPCGYLHLWDGQRVLRRIGDH